ncbi:MAG TPA: urease accessory UreF family protein, partial [Chloroflexota bacterium]
VEQSLARLDLVFVDHAYRVDLVELDRRYHVMQLVREPREASAAIGTSLLRSAADVLSDAGVGQFLRDGPHHHHSVAYGAVAAALDMPTELAMQSYALGSVRGQVSAAQRLGWIGQREAQRMLHRLKPSLLAAVADASSMNLDDVGTFVPTWDIAAMAHERADARMFAS